MHDQKKQYIQIWRALAVIAVIIFHFFPMLTPRGYLGVDLFFVISGFVITNSFSKYNKANIGSYLTFLASRINRLVPTLVLVLSILTILTIFFASPIAAQSEIFSGILANFFGVSNLFFYRKPSGYFAAPLEFSSVLHTWSLSLEWQFYTFIILLSIVSFYLQKKLNIRLKIKFFYLGVAIASLLFSTFQFLTDFRIPGLSNPVREQLFYLPPQRVYQFLFGGFLSFSTHKFWLKNNYVSYKVFLQIFLFTFFIFIILTDPPAESFDFIGSTLVVLVACLSITLGDFKIRKPLSLLTNVGNSSYSLYLWHWPIFVFIKLFLGDDYIVLCIGIILTFFFSMFTYKYIERNDYFSKTSGSMYGNSVKVFSSYVLLMIIVTFFLFTAKNHYWNQKIKSLAITQQDGSKFGRNCWTYPNFVSSKFEECRFPLPNQSGWVLLVGDSHAHSASDGIQEFYREHNLGLISYPLCDVSDNSHLCRKYLNQALKIAKHEDVKLVVFTGRLSRQLTLSKKEVLISNRLNWMNQLDLMNKKWLYILDVPNIGADPCGGFGWWKSEHVCRQKIKLMGKSEIEAREIEYLISRNIPPKNIFDPWDVFCDDRSCIASFNDIKLYADDNHLTLHGSFFLSKFLTWDSTLSNS